MGLFTFAGAPASERAFRGEPSPVRHSSPTSHVPAACQDEPKKESWARKQGRHKLNLLKAAFLKGKERKPAAAGAGSMNQEGGCDWIAWTVVSRSDAWKLQEAEKFVAARPGREVDVETFERHLEPAIRIRNGFLGMLGLNLRQIEEPLQLSPEAEKWLARLNTLINGLQARAFLARSPLTASVPDDVLLPLAGRVASIASTETARPFLPLGAAAPGRLRTDTGRLLDEVAEWAIPRHEPHRPPMDDALHVQPRLAAAMRIQDMFLTIMERLDRRHPDGSLVLTRESKRLLAELNNWIGLLEVRCLMAHSPCRRLLSSESLHAMACDIAWLRRIETESRYRVIDAADYERYRAVKQRIDQALAKCWRRLPLLRRAARFPELSDNTLHLMEGELLFFSNAVTGELARAGRHWASPLQRPGVPDRSAAGGQRVTGL